MDEDSRTTRGITHRFLRGLGIGGLAAIASLGLASRVNATSFDLDGAGDYIDREWYHFLDKGQYYYLDRGQYNLLGGLGYTFGRPYYQIRYDWGFHQFGKLGQYSTPEPSTIGYLGLGALIILGSMKYRKDKSPHPS